MVGGWSSGVLEYWSIGVLEYWSNGVLKYFLPITPSLQYSNSPVGLVEDPELAQSVEPFEVGKFFKGH